MAEPPTGAVTFLFTDIEGSTRLVRLLRDRYEGVQADHRRLLRAAFDAHSGYEVDTQGDSFFVAFASARDALLAAVEAQLALAAHDWPDGVEVNVRMGLHTGQAFATDGRYTGLAVHRAARIGGAGHGGQILTSQATQTMLEDDEEDLQIFLRDLGEQRLKDIDRPVRLYQAAANGLREQFPPVRGLEEAEPERSLLRRPASLAVATAVVIALVAAGVLLATRDSSSGLGAVRPNHVGVIDTETNEIVAEVAVGIRPGPIAVAGDDVWVGNLQDRTLTRVSAEARAILSTITLDNTTPSGLALSPGSVWVAHGALGQVSRVDPQFGRVASTTDAPSASAGFSASPLGSIAYGLGGVWAVFGDSTLIRVDPDSGQISGSSLAGSFPAGIAIGAGRIWVVNSGDPSVSAFEPMSFEQGALRWTGVGLRPSAIAYGHDALWVANSGESSMTRIDPRTHATATFAVGSEPVAVATSADAVWVANRSDATISRIDPSTNDVVETIELVNPPSGLAAGGGLLWVTVQAP